MSDWQEGWDRMLEEDRARARRAVELWADFPLTSPRPRVLLGQPVWTHGGFPSGTAKLAYVRRDWHLPPSAPDEVRQVARASAEKVAGRPEAVLDIQSVSRATAPFETDRGPVELPAWRLDSDRCSGPIWVLAAEVASTVWPLPGAAGGGHILQAAEVTGGHGIRLRVMFTGSSPLWVDYQSAAVVASEQAVAVLPIAHDTGPPGFRTMEGYAREVAVELRRRIGDRVLVNLDASPVAVLGLE